MSTLTLIHAVQRFYWFHWTICLMSLDDSYEIGWLCELLTRYLTRKGFLFEGWRLWPLGRPHPLFCLLGDGDRWGKQSARWTPETLLAQWGTRKSPFRSGVVNALTLLQNVSILHSTSALSRILAKDSINVNSHLNLYCPTVFLNPLDNLLDVIGWFW